VDKQFFQEISLFLSLIFFCLSVDYGSWFDYQLSWQRGLTQHPELNVLQLRYESLIQVGIMGVGLGRVVRKVRQHPDDHEFEFQQWQ
jgi:hypothetical protein